MKLSIGLDGPNDTRNLRVRRSAVKPSSHRVVKLCALESVMNKRSSTGMPKKRATRERTKAFPTSDEIADRAYQLLLEEGRRLDRFTDCWRRAENELLEQAANRAIPQRPEH